MQLSDRIQRVATSATMAMTQAARDRRASGKAVISLSVGEPDFATPSHILDAATRAMTDGHTRYTAADGIAELKQAITSKFTRDNGLTFTPAQINVSPGGKAVLWNALAVTVGPGDEVIIPAPCWVSYPDMVKLTGATPIILSGGTDFKITAEQLEAAITPATRWLMLNSPSNPTGAVYSAKELGALAAVLRRHPKVMVLSDDIYEALVFGEAKFATMASVAPDLTERTLTMNGVSKAYAMTGFRIGYGAGPEWLINAMRKFIGQTTSNPCSISQWAAVAALNGPHDFLDDWRSQYRTRGQAMTTALNKAGLPCVVPDGAFYVFADCTAVMAAKGFSTDADLAMALLEHAGVATVPGSAFYAPGHLRLSYAASMEEVTQACHNIAGFCTH
ncbi:aminotransferase [Algimonas arctica]|uniref:Aminotransferase n=1 Tax=Algimonas arctica TaxID=1479486 RepID=A0A8J3G2L8_9PROT|nr:pyridoxal phosphate-dependent aminotransferase [Algimonas arctica]GHA94795.1 aminotransferase [Algimonas arctica]